jgi:hypothetical protein
LRVFWDGAGQRFASRRIELREHVVEQEDRLLAHPRREPCRLGDLQGQHRAPVLPTGGELRQRAPPGGDDEIVSLRPDERCALPALALALLTQHLLIARRALFERVAFHLPGVRDGEALCAGEELRRGDEGRGELPGEP